MSAPPPPADATTTLQVLKERVAAFSAERDWGQFHTPKNLSMALAAEAAELMEHFLWAERDGGAEMPDDPRRRRAIAGELADIFIYGLQFANTTGIDLAGAIGRKMARNARRYPVARARGRATKYTGL